MKTEIKQRPILFSTPMVQAILEGRKTQTRRIVKDQILQENKYPENQDFVELTAICKFGRVGDVLWVRETFLPSWKKNGDDLYKYKADGYITEFEVEKWKPSIYMPKEACRLYLKITNIRLELLNDISESDAIAEGVEEIHPAPFLIRYKDYIEEHELCHQATTSFKTLWWKINGSESWKSNPYVWVIEFERIEKPIENA